MNKLRTETILFEAHKQMILDELLDSELSENEKTIKNNTLDFLNRKIWDLSCMIKRLDIAVDTFLEGR